MLTNVDLGWTADVEGVDPAIFRRGYLGPARELPLGVEMTAWLNLGRLVHRDSGLGYGEDRFDELVVFHTFSRVRPDQLIVFWSELYRVCKHGAIIRLTDVYWSHVDACADPTRFRGLSDRALAYLNPGGRHEVERDPYEDAVGTAALRHVDFEVVSAISHTEPEWEGRSDDARQQAAARLNNVVRRFVAVLRVHKPVRPFPPR